MPIGAKNGMWKGKNAHYVNKHLRIYNRFGQPDTCEHCKKSGLKGHKIHWANISGRYLPNGNDWKRLCAKCHKKFDFNLPDSCKLCGEKHYSKGLCKRCYARIDTRKRRAKKRLSVLQDMACNLI